MDDRALADVVSAFSDRIRIIDGGLSWDVMSTGIDGDGKVRIDVRQHWDSGRALMLAAVVMGLVGLVVVTAVLAFGIGHDAGMRDTVTSIQLPTR
jgi:hypothetical protein